MDRRPLLHEELCEILESRNVYFQPPNKTMMQYPCIRYVQAEPDQRYANDKNYKRMKRYEGLVIDRDPESVIAENLVDHFSMCRLGKPYVVDNLYHYPFTLYH